MSNEIKWIKIVTDIFDDEKILLIESLPESDSIIIIWFKLLCLAGKQNNSGVFTLNDKMPYTENMLATIFRRKESTVTLALNTFKKFGMIEIINDTITIPNWEKHQQLDAFEISKEKTRNRVNRYREKQKQLVLGEPIVNICAYCGEKSDTIDHIIPRSKGGTDDSMNIVECCKACNSSKHDNDIVIFLNDYYNNSEDIYRITKNFKLKKYVYHNGSKYCNVSVTPCNGDRIDKDIDNIYILGQKEGQKEVNDDPIQIESDKKIKKSEILDRFEIFWNLYPRKVKKQKAQEWFLKNRPNDNIFDDMINKLKQYINSNDWKKNDGQFIPHPTTWLNQERWLDEFEDKKQSSQAIFQTSDNTFKLK